MSHYATRWASPILSLVNAIQSRSGLGKGNRVNARGPAALSMRPEIASEPATH